MMVVCFASIIFATASCDNKNENCNLRNAEQSSPLQTVEALIHLHLWKPFLYCL